MTMALNFEVLACKSLRTNTNKAAELKAGINRLVKAWGPIQIKLQNSRLESTQEASFRFPFIRGIFVNGETIVMIPYDMHKLVAVKVSSTWSALNFHRPIQTSLCKKEKKKKYNNLEVTWSISYSYVTQDFRHFSVVKCFSNWEVEPISVAWPTETSNTVNPNQHQDWWIFL